MCVCVCVCLYSSAYSVDHARRCPIQPHSHHHGSVPAREPHYHSRYCRGVNATVVGAAATEVVIIAPLGARAEGPQPVTLNNALGTVTFSGLNYSVGV